MSLRILLFAVFGLGIAIALPAMLLDVCPWRPGVGPSEGVLVARIGMTLEEMRERSSLALSKDVDSPLTGSTTVVGRPVFDFEIADTAMRFERCRYYFITTGNHGDRKIEAISIGVSTEKVPLAELQAANARVQRALADDGWRPGWYAYTTPEDQALHGGVTENGRGFHWLKDGTLLHLASKRMDDEQPGEDPATAGEWIQLLELRPPSSDNDLTFAP
jgi:hypothetical protein